MVDEDINDIILALKNAVERGYSLDLAKTSLINAGYDRDEVEEAASKISSSSLHIANHDFSLSTISPIQTKSQPTEIKKAKEQIKKKTNKKIIFLIVVLILLFVALFSIIFSKL